VSFSKQERLHICRQILEQAWSFRHGGEVMATWFIHGQGQLQIVGTPFVEDVPDVKGLTAQFVAQMVDDLQPVEFAIFVSDAWTTMVEPGTDTRHIVPPSQSPNRVEAIFVQCWGNKPGQDFCICRRYRELGDGRLGILGEDELSQTDTATFAPVVEALRQSRSN